MKTNETARIKEEAKRILENFSKSLEKVNTKKFRKSKKRDLKGFREENGGLKQDDKFKEIMFMNAPLHNEDSIFAEKKTW